MSPELDAPTVPVLPGVIAPGVEPVRVTDAGAGQAGEIARLIAKLLREAEDPQGLLLAELNRLVEIADKDWDLPSGYKVRLTPVFLARIYKGGRTLTGYTKTYIT